MFADIDDFLETTLKWTLAFWIIPYVFWFFGRLLFQSAWNWVTEPERPLG